MPGWVRLLLVFAVLGAARAPLWAQGRQVAIVNLATDQEAGARLALELRQDLKKHPDLAPVAPGTVSRALEEPLSGAAPGERALAAATESLAEARAELVGFRNKAALRRLGAGFEAALQAEPSPEQAEILAELAFVEGRVELREQNRGSAREAFELSIRLTPDREPPDPRLFNPSIVTVYREAREHIEKAAELPVSLVATYDDAEIFVDGKRAGNSPLEIQLSAGLHVIAATRPGYATRARRIEIGQGARRRHLLDLVPLADDERARRLRALTISGRGEAAATARAAVDLTGASAALVIRDSAGELEYALCCSPDRQLSRFWPAGAGLGGLVALLVPVELPETALAIPPIRPEPAPWWERPGPIAGLVGGVAIASMLGVLALTVGSEIDDRTGTWGGF